MVSPLLDRRPPWLKERFNLEDWKPTHMIEDRKVMRIEADYDHEKHRLRSPMVYVTELGEVVTQTTKRKAIPILREIPVAAVSGTDRPVVELTIPQMACVLEAHVRGLSMDAVGNIGQRVGKNEVVLAAARPEGGQKRYRIRIPQTILAELVPEAGYVDPDYVEGAEQRKSAAMARATHS